MKSRQWFFARAWAQLLMWLAFLTLLIATRHPLDPGSAMDIYPRLSVHLGLAVSLTTGSLAVSFLPALVILAITLITGRFFCSTICPLGATIDAGDRLFNRRRSNAAGHAKKGRSPLKRIKYMVLALSTVLAAAGINAAGILDPLSLSVRSYATALYPYADHFIRLIFDSLYSVPVVRTVSEPVYDVLKATILDINPLQFLHHWGVMAFFSAILALSIFARRFWCQYLCPFGAVLALAGRFGMLKRKVDAERCTRCRKCERNCRMNAITDGGAHTIHAECIQCFECLSSCDHGATSFSLQTPFPLRGRSRAPKENHPSPALTRRDLVVGTVSAAILIPAFRLNPRYRMDYADIIRPPGALPEDGFLDACIRCGECMKVCPTNALHPQMFETGVEGVFTPRLVPRLGWCEKNCTLCTQVCPTGALKKLDRRQKQNEIIGTAVFIKDLCIPWADHRNCMVCEEVCPTATKSIRFRDEYVVNKQGARVRVKLPYVLEDICTGCGICENKCPVPGSSAIRVRTRKNIQLDNG